MFRRYPYKGWLMLSILLWCVTGFRYVLKTNEMTPPNMAEAIAEDLQANEKSLDKLLSDEVLMRHMFTEKLSAKEVERLTSLPYYIYAYDSGALVFWNTNEILVDCNYPRNNADVSLLSIDRGNFIKKCITIPYIKGKKRLTVLFPVTIKYPFENSYLESHYVAGSHIPLSSKITLQPTNDGYPITMSDGQTVFYITFPADDNPTWVPGKVMIWLLSLALLVSIIWIQLITVYLTRKRKIAAGFFLTVAMVLGVRVLTYIVGLPFNVSTLPIFSPQLYASSTILASLGDLLLNALCLLWIVIFTIRHVPHDIFRAEKLSKLVRLGLACVFAVFLIIYAFGFINIISTLVLDSRISFDVSHFYSITFYTLVGLFTIGIITGVSCLIIYMINVQLSTLVGSRWMKYGMVAVAGLIVILLTGSYASHKIYYLLLLWLLLFIFLMDIKSLTLASDLFAPQMLFWAVFVCAFTTGILQYFNHIKERETRKRFAEQVVKQRDYVTEYAFKNISQNIQKDAVLRNFIQHPTQNQRRLINERFDAIYLGGQLNKYQAKVLLFDANQNGLYNADTLSYKALMKELENSDLTMESTLFYKEDALDGRYYLAYIPVVKDSSEEKLGYVFIDLAVKESSGESVYPELLQPGSVKGSQSESGYSYGVYVKNKLITQASEYAFPVYLNVDTLSDSHTFINWENSSELWYKAGEDKTVIVIRYYKLWLESITLFSYLFGIQMLIVLFIVLYRILLSYFTKPKNTTKFLNLTFRNRIHFSMLGIVLISFTVLGLVTIAFFTVQYKQSNKKKLQLAMQIVERSTLQYLKQHRGMENPNAFQEETNTTQFKYFIASLANTQKIDINIFNASGILNVTSQENIYDKFLLARIIRPDAYYLLYNKNNSLVIQDESIGWLHYLSCYVPLRDDNGITMGYINVPYFASEKELNFQISNILVALINLYAFIFLVSSLLTVFITRWLTKTLSIIINRFERLSFTKNELIEWPYDDEIGALVKEYNKMVKKVEENAILLAQSEREVAWREMARQVAHEIKNPLTPMKLSIQYLLHAMRSGHPNMEELVTKASDSLIEQIDNLSYIASEFSNFAKMPEAKPEKIELNEILERAVELYVNEKDVKVSLHQQKGLLFVYMDRSQLLRVLTNLLENAVQSIPEDRKGKVSVMLEREDRQAIISISDNGTGITDEAAEKIFQPYFTTKSSGTGLGLAMTKKIIEFWKGEIWFTTKQGEGTTFFLKVPLMKK